MKYYLLLISFALVLFLNSSSFAQREYRNFSYSVIADLGTDDSDPLFSKTEIVDYVREVVNRNLSGFQYTSISELSQIVFQFTILTYNGNLGNFRYASSFEMLALSNSFLSANHSVLVIDNNPENFKRSIKSFIEKWIKEYSYTIN